MNTTLRTNITVADVCDGFVYQQFGGKGAVRVGRNAHHSARVPAELHLCGWRRQEGGGGDPLAAQGVSARTDLLQQSRGGQVRGAGRSAAHHQYRTVRYEQVAIMDKGNPKNFDSLPADPKS